MLLLTLSLISTLGVTFEPAVMTQQDSQQLERIRIERAQSHTPCAEIEMIQKIPCLDIPHITLSPAMNEAGLGGSAKLKF